MTYKAILIAPLLVAVLTMIGATAPNVYGKHLSDTKRYNDGYSNGSDAAARESTYNPTCDPTGAFTSDGQHSTTYCTGWADGYAATWNHTPGPTPIGPSPSPNTSLKDKFCNFVHSGDGAAASALVTLLGYPTVSAAAQAICV